MSDSGTATGTATRPIATCGDGDLAPPEQCDDANDDDGDGCSSGCNVEPSWECHGSARSVCQRCGNGSVEGDEECDEGSASDSRGCQACRIGQGWACTAVPGSKSECSPIVHRVQLRLQTSTTAAAATVHDIEVKLNDENSTWLNYSSRDFRLGRDDTYDLILRGVSELSDITMLELSLEEDDEWCLYRLQLLINGREVYERTFDLRPLLPQRCVLIGGDSSSSLTHYRLSRDTLTRHPLWNSFDPPAFPLRMEEAEVASRIQTIIGDALHRRNDLPWRWGCVYGSSEVESIYRKLSGETLGWDIDLVVWQAEEARWLEVDAGMKVTYSSASGVIQAWAEDPTAKVLVPERISDDASTCTSGESEQMELGDVTSEFRALIGTSDLFSLRSQTCPVISDGGHGAVDFDFGRN